MLLQITVECMINNDFDKTVISNLIYEYLKSVHDSIDNSLLKIKQTACGITHSPLMPRSFCLVYETLMAHLVNLY